MARIKKLIEPLSSGNGFNEIYPVTHMRSVLDNTGNNLPALLCNLGMSYTPLFPSVTVNPLLYNTVTRMIRAINFARRIIREIYIVPTNPTNANKITYMRLTGLVVGAAGANATISMSFVVGFSDGTSTTYTLNGTMITNLTSINTDIKAFTVPVVTNTVGINGDPITITVGVSTFDIKRWIDIGAGSLDLMSTGVMYLDVNYKYAANPVHSPNLG